MTIARSNACRGAAIACMAICAIAAQALGQQVGQHPLLDEMSRQAQSLYRDVAAGVVRVQLPTTLPSAQAAGDPLARWNEKVSPEILNQLRENPSFGVANINEIVPVPGATTALPRDTQTAPTPTTPATRPVTRIFVFRPNALGVVIDARGFVLLPAFVPAEFVGDKPLMTLLGDGTVTQSRFVGSDQKSNLTVLQLLHGTIRPLPFSAETTPEGSLVMVMTMDPAATHLGMWTRWSSNWGLVLRTDGSVAGFSQRGGFLSGAACAPVVKQLIAQGHVDRPRLGVMIRNVEANDPLRQFDPVLGQTPALRIWSVVPDSPAQRAGLQVGDLILSLAGEPVGNTHSFGAAISALHGPTQMQILRQDQIISVKVDLESQPSN